MDRRTLRIGVAFIPNECIGDDPSVYIVIDVIRATSTILTLFEQECSRIFLTHSVDKVTEYHATVSERLLICAENTLGQRLEGADISPSLSEIHEHGSFSGSRVVIQTSNGTAALHRLVDGGADYVYIGSMLNLKAVTEAAITTALEKGRDIVIVCAGRNTGMWITLDDVYCAAKMIEYALTYAKELDIGLTLFDSARITHSQISIYPDAITAFSTSASAVNLRNIGMTDDIALCAREDLSTLAPKICETSSYPFIEVCRT